jgi:thioredoxin
LADAADDSFDAILAGSTLPVLVDCWAEWCGPCHALAPVIERAATRHAGRLKVIKLDVDGAHLVASRLGIRSVPTLLLYRDGRLADRRAGAVGDAALDHWLAQQGVG